MRVSPDIEINPQEVPDVRKANRSRHNKSATCVQRFGLQFNLVRQRQK